MYSGVSGSRSAISKGSLDASRWWVQQDRTGKKSRILIPPRPIEPTLCWVKNAFWSLHLKRRQTCYLLFNAKGDIFLRLSSASLFLSFRSFPSSLACFLFPSPQPSYDTKRNGKLWWPKDLVRVSILGVWQMGDSRFKLMAYGSPFYSSIFTEKKKLTSLFQDTITLSLSLCFLRIEDWALKSETCRAINYLATRAGNQSY